MLGNQTQKQIEPPQRRFGLLHVHAPGHALRPAGEAVGNVLPKVSAQTVGCLTLTKTSLKAGVWTLLSRNKTANSARQPWSASRQFTHNPWSNLKFSRSVLNVMSRLLGSSIPQYPEIINFMPGFARFTPQLYILQITWI